MLTNIVVLQIITLVIAISFIMVMIAYTINALNSCCSSLLFFVFLSKKLFEVSSGPVALLPPNLQQHPLKQTTSKSTVTSNPESTTPIQHQTSHHDADFPVQLKLLVDESNDVNGHHVDKTTPSPEQLSSPSNLQMKPKSFQQDTSRTLILDFSSPPTTTQNDMKKQTVFETII